MLRILFVSLIPLESGESASIRNQNLIKGFVGLGYTVDVLTICSKIPDSCNLPINIMYLLSKRSTIRKTTVVSGRSGIRAGLKHKFITMAKKIYHKFSLYGSTCKYLNYVRIEQLPTTEYDVVVSSSDPVTSHMVIPKLGNQGLHWNKWIQYWGDPYIGDITRGCIYPIRILKWVEQKIQAGADKIVYVSPFTLESQNKLYPDLALKYQFLPIPYSEDAQYNFCNSHPLRLGYFGAYHSSVRNILPLYEACYSLLQQIHLYIVGNSDMYLETTPNITICDRTTREDLKQYELNCDIYVCILNIKGTQLPGKMYHYAGTNKPILVIVDGEEQEKKISYLKEFKRFVISKNNKQDICAVLNSLQTNRSAQPCEKLNPQVIAAQFLSDI